VGDLVVLKFHRFGPGYKPTKDHGHKLAPIGAPFRIVEKISPVAYRIDLPPSTRIHDVVSIIHLKRYRGTGDSVRPIPVEVDGQEEFEVEQIEGQRTNTRGAIEYLVKWKGYGEHERTWEPLDHLQHADQAVAEWHASRPDPPPPTNKRGSKNRRGATQ
jgi:hypothetical protein